jgi:hypothetical protein
MDGFTSPFFRHSMSNEQPSESPLFRKASIAADTSILSPLFRIDTYQSTLDHQNTPLMLSNEVTPSNTHSQFTFPDTAIAEERTRRPPMTRLERLGSCGTWCVLLLPLLLFGALLFAPPTSTSTLLKPNECPSSVTCNSYRDFEYSFTFRSHPLLLRHIDVHLITQELPLSAIDQTTLIVTVSSGDQPLSTTVLQPWARIPRIPSDAIVSIDLLSYGLARKQSNYLSISISLSGTSAEQYVPLTYLEVQHTDETISAMVATLHLLIFTLSFIYSIIASVYLYLLAKRLHRETGRNSIETLVPEQVTDPSY